MVKVAEQANEIITRQLDKYLNKSVEYTLRTIQTRTMKLQKTFFQYLATESGIIGASSQPSLPNPSGQSLVKFPKWDTGFSLDYRYRKTKEYQNNLFINTGELKRTLQKINPINTFGMPLITFKEKGGRGSRTFESFKTVEGFKSSSTKTFVSNRELGVVSIKLFPKVKEGFKERQSHSFFTTFFPQRQRANSSGSKPAFLGMKLDNSKVARPFIGQYMDWWVKVKAKQTVLKGLA